MAIRYQAKKGPLENARAIRDVSELEDDQEENVFGQKADSSIFGEAAKDLVAPAPLAAAARQQRDEAERAQGETVPPPEEAPPEEAPPEEAPVQEPDEPQGLFEDLGDIDTRQERERQAFADELESRRAEAMQQAQARAGLGGMGLSGATAALTSDIGRQEARAGDIAMADLARRRQQETFDELRRTASSGALEEEFGVDLYGDGSQSNPGAAADAQDEEGPKLTASGEEIIDVAGDEETRKQSNQEKYDAYHNQVETDAGLMAASAIAGGGIEAWAAANGAEEVARYRDENGVEWRVFRKGDGSYVKGTAMSAPGLVESLFSMFDEDKKAKRS